GIFHSGASPRLVVEEWKALFAVGTGGVVLADAGQATARAWIGSHCLSSATASVAIALAAGVGMETVTQVTGTRGEQRHLHATDREVGNGVVVRAEHLFVAKDFIAESVHVVQHNANLIGSDKVLRMRKK